METRRTDLELPIDEHELFNKIRINEGRSKKEMVKYIVRKFMKEYKFE